MSYIQPTSYELWFVALASSASIGLTSLVPCALDTKILGRRDSLSYFSQPKEGPGGRLKLLLSFAVGSILGDIFLHLIPESIGNERTESSKNAHFRVGLSVIAGFLMFIVAEKLMENFLPHILGESQGCSTGQQHGRDLPIRDQNNNELQPTKVQQNNSHQNKSLNSGFSVCSSNNNSNNNKKVPKDEVMSCSKQHTDTAGYLNLIANGFDNFTHGLTVGASFLAGFKVGLITTFVIIIHEIPHEICDYAILIRSGFSRWSAIRAQSSTAIFGILGTAAALSAKSIKSLSSQTSWILPFSSGGFLYIALVNILPELLDKRTSSSDSIKQVICVTFGIAFMAVVAVL